MLIRRVGDQLWREPTSTAFDDEAALQQLVQQSPEILPGGRPSPLVIAREVYIPETGPVDLITVSLDGTLRLIECKLRANSDIRRAVVGQVLAYASGLWRRSYEEFDSAFQSRHGSALAIAAQATADADSIEFDEHEFIDAVTANLATGRFHLVIAVDEITPELKRTIEYLNEHTITEVSVLALELTYVRDADVEILVPTVYGEEGVRRKETTTERWDEQRFRAALRDYIPEPQLSGILRVVEHGLAHCCNAIYWGGGKYPSANVCFALPTNVVVWSVYTDPTRTVFAFNFDWMRNGQVSTDAMEHLADAMRVLPGVTPLYSDLAQKEYRRRPSIPVIPLFSDERAADVIIGCVDRLLEEAKTGHAPALE